MSENKPFDHEEHCRLLDDAARQLRLHDRDNLAGAVERARMIHIDYQGRIATLRREERRIRAAMDRLQDIAQTLRDYVLKPEAPWIGCDLFPKEPPGGL